MQQLFNNFYNKILHGYKSSYIDFTHQSYVAIWVNKSSPHQRCAKYILNTQMYKTMEVYILYYNAWTYNCKSTFLFFI